MANGMNFNNFTNKSQEAVQRAMEIATAKQNQAIETSHLLKGMLIVDENVIPYLLKKLKVNPDSFTPLLDRIVDSYPEGKWRGAVPFPGCLKGPRESRRTIPVNPGLNLSPWSIFSWEFFWGMTALQGS